MPYLTKKDSHSTVIQHGVLNVFREWLKPLPDESLPCIKIRESILELLLIFPTLDAHYLKKSGIGKALFNLYRNPSAEDTMKLAGRVIEKLYSGVMKKKNYVHKSIVKNRRYRGVNGAPLHDHEYNVIATFINTSKSNRILAQKPTGSKINICCVYAY